MSEKTKQKMRKKINKAREEVKQHTDAAVNDALGDFLEEMSQQSLWSRFLFAVCVIFKAKLKPVEGK